MGYEERRRPYQDQVEEQKNREEDAKILGKYLEQQDKDLLSEVLKQLEVREVFLDIKNDLWKEGEIHTSPVEKGREYFTITTQLNSGNWSTLNVIKNSDLTELYTINQKSICITSTAYTKGLYNDPLLTHIEPRFIRGTYELHISARIVKDREVKEYSFNDPWIIFNTTLKQVSSHETIPSYKDIQNTSMLIIKASEKLREYIKFPLTTQIQEDRQEIIAAIMAGKILRDKIPDGFLSEEEEKTLLPSKPITPEIQTPQPIPPDPPESKQPKKHWWSR